MQLRKTLVGLTPGQIKALSPEEFRACFAATPANALRPAQRLLIEADETLGKIARESLNGKAHKKRVSTASARKPVTLVGLTLEEIKALSPEEFRMCFTSTPVRALTSEQLAFIDAEKSFREAAHAVLNERESKQNSMRVDLPKKLAAFVAQQVETGLYRDASEVVSESLRFFQKQTDMQLLRLTLERETQARIREFEEGRFQADEELLERLRRASSASARGGVRKRRANDLGVTA
jgi:antitoxin ParD1/3/4